MLVSQPDTGEQALEITDALVRSGAVDAVVVDSVAALVPKQEIEGEMGDTFVGLQARLMSQALRKLAGTIAKTNCVVIFINQLRMKIGVMYGNPETTTGGNALKFYSSVRLDVRRVEHRLRLPMLHASPRNRNTAAYGTNSSQSRQNVSVPRAVRSARYPAPFGTADSSAG